MFSVAEADKLRLHCASCVGGGGQQVTQHTTDTYITVTSGDRIELWRNLPSSGTGSQNTHSL